MMRVERYRRNRWHRSRLEEIATTLLGALGLMGLAALIFYLTP